MLQRRTNANVLRTNEAEFKLPCVRFDECGKHSLGLCMRWFCVRVCVSVFTESAASAPKRKCLVMKGCANVCVVLPYILAR